MLVVSISTGILNEKCRPTVVMTTTSRMLPKMRGDLNRHPSTDSFLGDVLNAGERVVKSQIEMAPSTRQSPLSTPSIPVAASAVVMYSIPGELWEAMQAVK